MGPVGLRSVSGSLRGPCVSPCGSRAGSLFWLVPLPVGPQGKAFTFLGTEVACSASQTGSACRVITFFHIPSASCLLTRPLWQRVSPSVRNVCSMRAGWVGWHQMSSPSQLNPQATQPPANSTSGNSSPGTSHQLEGIIRPPEVTRLLPAHYPCSLLLATGLSGARADFVLIPLEVTPWPAAPVWRGKRARPRKCRAWCVGTSNGGGGLLSTGPRGLWQPGCLCRFQPGDGRRHGKSPGLWIPCS